MNETRRTSLERFLHARASLDRALAEPIVTARDEAGAIKNFEFVFETCFKALRDRLANEGLVANSPRQSFVQAYKAGWIDDEETWLRMLEDRNLTVHTYNEGLAHDILERIQRLYAPAFAALSKVLTPLPSDPTGR